MVKKHIHTKIYVQSHYTEGPVTNSKGDLFFTTLEGGRIMKMSADGTITEWARSLSPNGQIILPNGHHIVCDSQEAALIRFDAESNFLQKDIDGFCGSQAVQVPNDLITDKKGNIYFTDSVRQKGQIGYIGSDGEQKIVAKELDYPNGLALSKNEKILFVAESYQNRILAFDLEANGSLTNKRILANLPQHPSKNSIKNLPDGIKVDEENHLWVAHYGMGAIHRLSTEGVICQSIRLPFNLPSNLFLHNNTIVVTGGYSEPGPGCVAEITLSNE
jgi:gluconolactonase